MWNGARVSQSKSEAKPSMTKLGLALNRDLLKLITDEATRRGISVQALIRAVIIPDWVKLNLEESNSDTNDSIRNNGSIFQKPATSSRPGVILLEDQIMSSPRLRR
jgi:hypothetical protein